MSRWTEPAVPLAVGFVYFASVISRLHSSRAIVSLACVILGTLPASGGCSFVFVQPPIHEDGFVRAGDCTTNVAPELIDTLLAGTNLFSALYVANDSKVTNKGSAVTVGLMASAFWLSSAIYGYYYTAQCADLKTVVAPQPYERPRRFRRPVRVPPPRPAPPPSDEGTETPSPGIGPTEPLPPAEASPPAPPVPPVAPTIPQQKDDDEP